MKKMKSMIFLAIITVSIIAVSTISTPVRVNAPKPSPTPEPGPAALMIPMDESPGTEIDPALVNLQLYPIQAVYGSDIDLVALTNDDDGTLDMVLGKPMAVQVCVGKKVPEIGTTVSVTVAGITLSTGPITSTAELLVSGKYIFSVYPFVITNDGEYTITGTLTNSTNSYTLIPATIKVSGTSDLSIAFSYLDGTTLDRKGAYGDISLGEYELMAGESSRFMNSTYPIASLIADESYVGLVGAEKASHSDPYSALLYDCIAAANEAQSRLGGSAFGIAIGPDETNTGKDYFTWHGFPDVAGVSFGPGVKGVIVLDDYISAGAHEIGHGHGLYYGEPEQYYQYPDYGLEAYGVDLQEALDTSYAHWRAGICFMGAGPDETMAGSWVSQYVWESLFLELLDPNLDPLALQASGVIRGDTVERGKWTLLSSAFVDNLNPPDATHKLVFYDSSHVPGEGGEVGYLGEVSFDASPIVIIDPKETNKISQKMGEKPTNHGAFSFTCAIPEPTFSINIVRIGETLENDVILDTVLVDDLLFIDNWMSNSQNNRITQIETHFTYDKNNDWYNLKNSNAGQLKYHLIVDPLEPETILEIQLPLAEFHHGDPVRKNADYEPAFDFLSDEYIRIWEDSTRQVEITDTVDWSYDPVTRTFTIPLVTPPGSKPYIELKLDYAVENDDAWRFKTGPTEYLQELPIVAQYQYYDTWLNREMTARAITRFRAVGIW